MAPVFSRIVVPLDGSTLAEQAVPVAVGLAERLGARLVFLQASPPTWWMAAEPAQLSAALGQDVIDAFLTGAKAYLEEVAARWRRPGLTIVTEVIVALPTMAIVDCAAAEPHTLVVMTTHGRSGLARTALGSIALGVVGANVGPVILIRPAARQPTAIHRILVALDGSPAAELVLAPAEDLARALGASLVLCRVRLPGELPNEVDRYLAAVAEPIRQRGLAVEIRPADNHPADAIVETATIVEADLIALTTHGRTSLGTLIFGSVAEAVLSRAPVPVLLIKRPSG